MVAGSRSFILAALALPSALAVSLADFQPAAHNLDQACEAVYTASINGCQDSDFSGGLGCSMMCINALNSLVPVVTSACLGVTGGNIIAAIIAGKATALLCPNVGTLGSATTAEPMTTTAQQTTQMTTSTMPSSTSTSTTPSMTSTTTTQMKSSTTTSVVMTGTLQPKSSSFGSSIVYDTSTPPTMSVSTHTTKASPSSIDQGGSPFSQQAGLSSAASGALKISSLLLTAAIGGAAVLLF